MIRAVGLIGPDDSRGSGVWVAGVTSVMPFSGGFDFASSQTALFSVLAQIPSRLYSADDILSPYIYVFYAAFTCSFIFTPIMRYVAIHYRVVDEPDGLRKVHKVPVAYLGGVAIFLGWLAGLAISQFLQLHRVEPGWPTTAPIVKFSLVMGGLSIALLGLWDDIAKLSPKAKIIGQVFAALMLLWDGVGVDCARPLLWPIGVRLTNMPAVVHFFYGDAPFPGIFFPDWVITVASGALVIMLVVGCCNASNLMDGLDGLCGGVTAIIAAGFLFVAVHLAMTGQAVNTNTDALRVILGLALLGAVLGFVPYNFNPASIFMGDTGSMLLGFSCAAMIVLMGQQQAKWLLAAMVMFALPILDTTLAFARRYLAGRPLFSADKQHFHHQLLARGFTVKQSVLIAYSLAAGFGVMGMVMVFVRTRYAVALYLVTFGSLAVAAYKMGMIHERIGNGRPKPDPEPQPGKSTDADEPTSSPTAPSQPNLFDIGLAGPSLASDERKREEEKRGRGAA